MGTLEQSLLRAPWEPASQDRGPGPQGWDTSWHVAGGQTASVTGPLRSAQAILPEGLLCHGLVCGPGGNWVTLGAWHAHRPRTRRMLCVCRMNPRAEGGRERGRDWGNVTASQGVPGIGGDTRSQEKDLERPSSRTSTRIGGSGLLAVRE